MPRPVSAPWALLIALLAAGCGGDSTGASNNLKGSASDPEGDGGLADLVAATVTATSDSVILEASFAPGLMGTGNLQALYVLDIDANGASGDPSQDPAGAEYWVLVSENAGSVTIYNFQANNWIGLGSAGAIYHVGDKLVARLARTALGSSTGPLRFKVQGAAYDASCPCYAEYDLLPDAGAASVKVQ